MSTGIPSKDQSNKQRYPHSNIRPKRQLLEELTESRIITKNLVYVIGLSSSIANRDKLLRYEYFGQYGSIVKIVVDKNKAYNQNSPNGPSYSAYVTFSKPCEASIAILSLDETMVDNHLVRASFGTTKYCSFFLKGIECTNKDCLFLHKLADESDIIKRGDLNSNKSIFAQQHSYAIKIADVYNPEVKKKILSSKKGKTVFPSPDLIYRSIFVIENDPNYHKGHFNNKKNNINNFNNNNNINNTLYEIKKESRDINSIKTSPNHITNSINTETTSTSSKEDINENILSNSKDHKLFLSPETSRFGFVTSPFSAPCSGVEVPLYVKDLINKQIVLRKLTKFMNNHTIESILQNEKLSKKDINNKEDDWTKFILDNTDGINFSKNKKHIKNKKPDEFLQDIENINSFILDKCHSDFSNFNLNKRKKS